MKVAAALEVLIVIVNAVVSGGCREAGAIGTVLSPASTWFVSLSIRPDAIQKSIHGRDFPTTLAGLVQI